VALYFHSPHMFSRRSAKLVKQGDSFAFFVQLKRAVPPFFWHDHNNSCKKYASNLRKMSRFRSHETEGGALCLSKTVPIMLEEII
jgi:hypothetical protein